MELSRYLLECPGDGRDMAPAIEQALAENGACLLGAGTFYVSGVTMPHGTTLAGLGNATAIVLKKEVTDGAAVTMNSFCTVKDLTVVGEGKNGLPAAAERCTDDPHGRCEYADETPKALGTRHGILFAGTATTKEWSGQPHNGVIENCRIFGFSGGGITCVDTGYSINASMTVSDCHILCCGAGICIPHYSEYHKFTNVLCSDNFIGCLNNGGNNVFMNCGFNSNITAFVIDNRDGKAVNNTHGAAIGCTFNHSDRNQGVGIAVYGASWGFVFSGGNLGFSKIVVENSTGVQFSAMNFLHTVEISAKGPRPVLFCGDVFHKKPIVTLSEGGAVRFADCFTVEGEPIE